MVSLVACQAAEALYVHRHFSLVPIALQCSICTAQLPRHEINCIWNKDAAWMCWHGDPVWALVLCKPQSLKIISLKERVHFLCGYKAAIKWKKEIWRIYHILLTYLNKIWWTFWKKFPCIPTLPAVSSSSPLAPHILSVVAMVSPRY